MKTGLSYTHVYSASKRKIRMLAAALGVTQPDALDRVLDEAMDRRRLRLDPTNSQTPPRPQR